MVFEPNFTKVVSSVRKNIGTTQSVIEFKLPTNENNITKIFSVGAKSVIVGSEAVGKEVSFMGLVDFQAVYEGDNVSAVDYTAEFKDKLVSDEAVNGELILISNVVDVNSSIVSGGINVVAVVEVSVEQIVNKEVSVLTSVNGDDAHIATNEITYSTFLGKAYEKFDINEEVIVERANNVLMVTPCVSLYSVEPKDNYIAISGRLELDINYQTGEESYGISTVNREIEFSWEVAYSGVEDTSCVQSVIGVLTNEIKISTLIEDGNAKMNVFIPIMYTGYVFVENKLNVIEDLYLEKNYLSITCENFQTINCSKSICFKDNISGTAIINDSSPFIDEVLSVCPNNVMIASARVEDERLSVEGVANTSVLYYTKETDEITAVQVDMPFSVEQKIDGENGCVVSVCLSGLSARSKRGKEIEVSAGLSLYVDVYSQNSCCVISDTVLGEEKPQEDCSLYIYVVKEGQTIWDVAKDTSMSQEIILEQNPNIELPIKAGNKLVVYKSCGIKFE